MKPFEAGDKIEYYNSVKDEWLNGVIHGVRMVDDAEGNPHVLSYLVDTGKDAHLDVRTYNLKHEAYKKAYAEHNKKRPGHPDFIKKHNEAYQKATEATAHLKDEIVEEVTRQPEQIDVPAEHIRPPSG